MEVDFNNQKHLQEMIFSVMFLSFIIKNTEDYSIVFYEVDWKILRR